MIFAVLSRDLELAGSDGMTALAFAKEKNRPEMIRLLQPTDKTRVLSDCLGYPSSDREMRLFSEEDCVFKLGGVWKSGECFNKEGGSYSLAMKDRNVTCRKERACVPVQLQCQQELSAIQAFYEKKSGDEEGCSDSAWHCSFWESCLRSD